LVSLPRNNFILKGELGFPGGSVVKNLLVSARDTCLTHFHGMLLSKDVQKSSTYFSMMNTCMVYSYMLLNLNIQSFQVKNLERINFAAFHYIEDPFSHHSLLKS